MCFPTGSTAYATMACWPVPSSKPISQRFGAYSTHRPPNKMTRKPQKSSRSHFASHVRNAAARCASWKSSTVARSHNPALYQGGRPHDGTPLMPPNWILKRTAFQDGSDLRPVALIMLRWPRVTVNHAGQCRKSTQKLILAGSTSQSASPPIASPGTALTMLSP